MSKYILIASLILIALPGLVLAEIATSPQIVVTSPSPTGIINVTAQTLPVTIRYTLNRNQGLFNIDLCRDNCLTNKAVPITKGRYVNLNKKDNCTKDDLCRYTFNWVLNRNLIKESGKYYFKVCYLMRNQGSTQVITCANSANFTINLGKPANLPTPIMGTSSKAVLTNLLQLANLWGIVNNFLGK